MRFMIAKLSGTCGVCMRTSAVPPGLYSAVLRFTRVREDEFTHSTTMATGVAVKRNHNGCSWPKSTTLVEPGHRSPMNRGWS
jgi:hypothetical protein